MAFQAPKWQGDPNRFTTELLAWLEAAGATRYDEVVTQYEHAVQSAALAGQRGGNPALVVAALLHDVGHLLLAEHGSRNGFLALDLVPGASAYRQLLLQALSIRNVAERNA
jgi:hypothetical protein